MKTLGLFIPLAASLSLPLSAQIFQPSCARGASRVTTVVVINNATPSPVYSTQSYQVIGNAPTVADAPLVSQQVIQERTVYVDRPVYVERPVTVVERPSYNPYFWPSVVIGAAWYSGYHNSHHHHGYYPPPRHWYGHGHPGGGHPGHGGGRPPGGGHGGGGGHGRR